MDLILNIKTEKPGFCENAYSFLQSAMWGEFKSFFGWKADFFLVEYKQNKTPAAIRLLVLSRRLKGGLSFSYVPWGPRLPDIFTSEEKAEFMSELAMKLKPFLLPNAVFIRFDPPWHTAGGDANKDKEFLLLAGFKQAAAAVQPPDTVHINLEQPDEQILSGMKPKWRYNISLAGKKGVIVTLCSEENLPDGIQVFFKLLKETAARDGIAVHGINYYQKLFDHISERNKKEGKEVIRLYIANHEGDNLAAIVVLYHERTATYLYGASSNTKRNLMAAYALQWKAMQDAKKAGCLVYDLFGIPPDDDPTHPMAGLYRFKTGFGGEIIHRPGSWDYVYKPVIYKLFNTAESLRKKYFNSKKRRH